MRRFDRDDTLGAIWPLCSVIITVKGGSRFRSARISANSAASTTVNVLAAAG